MKQEAHDQLEAARRWLEPRSSIYPVEPARLSATRRIAKAIQALGHTDVVLAALGTLDREDGVAQQLDQHEPLLALLRIALALVPKQMLALAQTGCLADGVDLVVGDMREAEYEEAEHVAARAHGRPQMSERAALVPPRLDRDARVGGGAIAAAKVDRVERNAHAHERSQNGGADVDSCL